MAADDDWPYDADQHDPLAKLRIPVVGDAHPMWKYEVCMVITKPGTPEHGYWPSLRPDDAEVKMILAELDWRMTYYNEGWKAKMRRRPLDVDGSTNTVVLRKRPDGGWCYRRASWTRGPMMIPAPGEVMTLEQVLDRCNDTAGQKWLDWKASHPEAFGKAASRG